MTHIETKPSDTDCYHMDKLLRSVNKHMEQLYGSPGGNFSRGGQMMIIAAVVNQIIFTFAWGYIENHFEEEKRQKMLSEFFDMIHDSVLRSIERQKNGDVVGFEAPEVH